MGYKFDIAILGAYVALVKLLHEKKVIDINDLVASIGDTIDFANMKHMNNPTQQESRQIYEHLQQIAAAMLHAESMPPE